MGIIVPKHRHTSVERNRVKRRLREIVRVEMLPLTTGMDVVVRARANVYGASFLSLRMELANVGRQLRGG